MITRLAHVSIPVDDYDEALKWYTEILGFEVRHDNTFGEGYRFLTVGAKQQQDLEIVLVKNQPGMIEVSKVSAWVFDTDDCARDVESLRERGVQVLSEPEDVPWGVQATFADPFGNSYVLVEEKGLN
jgi:predicted enzyme related to lactoylglutathione lyase